MPRTASQSTLLATIAVACTLVAGPTLSAPTQELRLNTPIERTLSGQEEDTYSIRLEKNQRLKAVAEQKGLDVVVQILSPKGEVLATIDSPTGDKGLEPIEWIAAESGTYRIVIKPLEANAKPGKYEVRLLEVRKATHAELERARADQEIKQAEKEWFAARVRLDEPRIRSLSDADFARSFSGGPLLNLDQYLDMLKDQEKRAPGALRDVTTGNLNLRLYGDTVVSTGRLVATIQQKNHETRLPSMFVHIWRRQNGSWRLANEEVFAATPEPQQHRIVKVSADLLRGCAGKYELPNGATYIVETTGDHLIGHPSASPASSQFEFYPENDSEFYTETGEICLTFVRDSHGAVSRLLLTAGVQTTRMTRVP